MMLRQIWLLAAVLPAIIFADEDNDVYFTGDGSANALGQAGAEKCNSGIGEYYAALNSDQWNETLNCGKCVQVVCEDDRCKETPAVKLFVVDQCPDCGDEGLDLSPTVFKQVTGNDPTRFTLKWEFVDCPGSAENFKNLNSNPYRAGTVGTPNEESNKGVSILEDGEKEVEKTDSANTKAGNTDAESSSQTPFVVLVVAAAVGCVGVAAIGFTVRKKLALRKREEFTTQSFDTFSSPAHAKATIAKF